MSRAEPTPVEVAMAIDAAQTFARICDEALFEHAEGFTCDEADTVAEFLRHWHPGGAHNALAFLRAHAEHDDDDEAASHDLTEPAPIG